MKSDRIKRSFLLASSLSLSVVMGSVNAAGYSFSIIPGLDGSSSAYDINNKGQVVGYHSNHGLQAFLYDSTEGTKFLPSSTFATNINDAGQVIGSNYNGNKYSFIYDSNTGSRQRIKSPDGDFVYLSGINNNGLIVGNLGNTLGVKGGENAFKYDTANGMQYLSHNSYAYPSVTDLNDKGQAVGNRYNNHAFLWDTDNSVKDLGTLEGGIASYATAINESGQVVGTSLPSATSSRAFIWDDKTGMKDLGTLGDEFDYNDAYDINESGQVIGVSRRAQGRTPKAFIYDSINGMQNLNKFLTPSQRAEWVLVNASAINDHGDIVGYAYNSQSEISSAFILNYDSGTTVSPVPEPPMAWLFAPALLGLIGLRRKKQKNP